VVWIALQWLVNLLEVVAVIGAILAIGAAIAVGAFWLLYRTVCKLAGPSVESESCEYEMDVLAPDDPSIELNKAPSRSKPARQ
jgi:hypothetical protein